MPWMRKVLASTHCIGRAGEAFTEITRLPSAAFVTSVVITRPRDGPEYLPTNDVASPAKGFGGLEHLFGGVWIDRRAGVQHPVDGGHAEARLGGNGGDGWAFIVVHGKPLMRLDRKLSSPAGPG